MVRSSTQVQAAGDLAQGRESCARRAWADAHAALSRADASEPLQAADLELLATAAYMLGRDDGFVAALERAHRAHLDADEIPRAVRCAFWIGITLMLRGHSARATGWFGRAERLLGREERDCVERGYLLIPLGLAHGAAGDWDAAYATAAETAAIAERFGDRDLLALAVQDQGCSMIRRGQGAEGVRLLDEAMVAATAGELSPIVTGLVYCSVITFCQEICDLRRAQEWTAGLARWCEEQPDMVAHTGQCLVHRAEILQVHGAWPDALNEARRAAERFARARNETAAGHALYRQGEIHRMTGDFDAAEDAYRTASRHGFEPQPGLALLRLAQGNSDAAATAMRRLLTETPDRLSRARLLPAYVDAMLAAGDVESARTGCRELAEIAAERESAMLDALVAQSRGAVELAEGEPGRALLSLRRACESWHELDAPYEIARVRVLLGQACRALGDEEAATLELDAARAVFERLGAVHEVSRLTGLTAKAPAGGLTARELQVLRLVAAGATNKAIAAELVLSERTVDRHVSNILAKLRVSSRSAATAFAYEHELL